MKAFSEDWTADFRSALYAPGRGADASVRRVFDELNPDADESLRPYKKKELSAAAVLIPILDKAPEPTVLLTVRSSRMPSHPGQISLPGGRIQTNDASPEDAALRETWEETGIHPDYVTPLGELPVHEGGLGFAVTPIVGVVRPGYRLQADEREVAEIFETPLSRILNETEHYIETRRFGGEPLRFRALKDGGRTIWGLTASILYSLHEALKD
ncbi:MAG: CoA pyrophosphatase [Pseudomonadota bacterium]